MKTFFVIQGHTKYCDQILDCFKNIDNVIWSTDNTSPKEDLLKISNSNIQLVLIPKLPPGFGNVNLHIISSLSGIKAAKHLGADMVIKIRSDITISDPNKFRKLLKQDGKLYSNNYVKHNNIITPPNYLKLQTKDWLLRNCGNIENICDFNYLTDWIYYGDIETMLFFYNKCIRTELDLGIITEHRFIGSYLRAINKPIKFDLEYLKSYFGIFMGDMNKAGITLYSLKEKLNYSQLDKVIPGVYIGD